MNFEDKGHGSGSNKSRLRWTARIGKAYADLSMGVYGTGSHFDLKHVQTDLTNMVIEIEEEFIRVGQEEGT